MLDYPSLIKGKYVDEDYRPHVERLGNDLYELDPNLVICLGNTPLWALASDATCNYLDAGDDVDQDALKEAGGIAGKSLKATYYLTEEAAYRLKEFLAHLGIEEQDTLRPMIEEATGKQFLGTIRHEPSQDGTRIFARLGQTAPVGE